jgi:hypothetical protein
MENGDDFFFLPDAPPILGSLAWDDFREKFRVPVLLFNWILHAAKKSGKFPNETPESSGHDPHPLCPKIAAYFRYLATGAQVNAHEKGLGISREALQKFFPKFGD